jgi:hypothetical protein
MGTKGWVIKMGWVVLCSTNLVFANESEHSSRQAKHLARDKKSSRRTSLHLALKGEASENFVDLSQLYSVLIDDGTRDYAMGKGCHAKNYRLALRLLWRYLFSIPDLEYSDEEFSEEEFSEEEAAEEEKHSEEEKSKNDEEYSEEDLENAETHCSVKQVGKKLFPTARQLKAQFTTKKLLRMDIDLDRLLKIENLRILSKSRPFTQKENSLLNKAIRALDRSPEQRLLNAISSASKTPQKAFKTVKSIVKKEGVDVNSAYEGIQIKVQLKEYCANNKSSFLHRAANVGKNKGLAIIQFLLYNETDIDLVNRGETALHTAIRKGNTEVARLLISRGANINAQARQYDVDGWTPLHLALYYWFFEIAELLLDHGADPSIQDDEGKTPLDIAIEEREKTDVETTKRKYDEILDKLRAPST